jgi:phospholipid/cholesterol/gamma-HCH transport system substrate-binding protein
MEDSNYRFGVGVLVLAACIICVLLIAFFGRGPSIWEERYRISINFPRTPRVTVDTPVRKNGVTIGRVASVFLRPGNGGVDLTLEIKSEYQLKKEELPIITMGSLITGDSVVEFVAPTQASMLARFDGITGTARDGMLDEEEQRVAQELLAAGDYLSGGEVAKDPFEALASVGPAFERFDQLAAILQESIDSGTGPIRNMADSFQTTLNSISDTSSTINRVARQIEDARVADAISRSIALLPQLFTEAQTTLQQTQRTLRGIETFSNSLEGIGKDFEGIGLSVKEAVANANRAIENIAEITEPVKQNSEVLVERATTLLANLDVLSTDLRRFATRLNNGNGTIKQLIDDDRLYFQAIETMRNIETASANVRQIASRLQPIVDDARVFADKVARDPGQLGVRGALSGRSLGTGLK